MSFLFLAELTDDGVLSSLLNLQSLGLLNVSAGNC